VAASASLTSSYLAEVAARGMPHDRLIEVAREQIELAATSYDGSCLTRPVFLAHAEFAVLRDDLLALHAALASLPGRLFGGDVTAFARAVGMTGLQLAAVAVAGGQPPTRLGRADLFRDARAFRVMELNLGSALGGLDNALLNRAFLTEPAVAEFVATHGLSYTDTMGVLAATLKAECGIGDGEQPLIAVADWPDSFGILHRQLRAGAGQLARYGLTAVACQVGELSYRSGRVWLDGRPVDLVYRVFLIKDLLRPEAGDLAGPLLRAAARGEVKLFAPMDAEVYGSKGALALLSDEANRHLFTAAELARLDRILPWTRMVRPGPVTVDGSEADMTGYARAEREHLVLKPTALHSGAGVIQGWLTSPDEWRDRLTAAMDGPYVLQRRIRPLAEPFPAPGGVEPWVLWWGAFLGAPGYGGAIVRGSTDPDAGIKSMPHGSTGTCCFHQPEPRAGLPAVAAGPGTSGHRPSGPGACRRGSGPPPRAAGFPPAGTWPEPRARGRPAASHRRG
jgi:hypothetical protein